MSRHRKNCECYACFDVRLQRYMRWSRRLETVAWAIITALVIWLVNTIDNLPVRPCCTQQQVEPPND